jgi:hypothetical protein
MDSKISLSEIQQDAVYDGLREQGSHPWATAFKSLCALGLPVESSILVAFCATAWIANTLAEQNAATHATILGSLIVVSATYLACQGSSNATPKTVRADTSTKSRIDRPRANSS